MKLFFMIAATVIPFRQKEPESPLTQELYKRIRKLCRAATGGDSGLYELRYEELYDAVMEKLLADDCKRLREVKNKDAMSLWLRTVIKNVSSDLTRKIKGRPDWEKFGDHSKLICTYVLKYEYPAEEAQLLLWEHPPHVEVSI
jgi:DNA-directed RNA polymerase specialized sigma24 family protein